MKRWPLTPAGTFLAAAVLFVGLTWGCWPESARRAEPSVLAGVTTCQRGCLSTFCGASSDCPPGCFCAIPLGGAVGECSGTR
jgi:hypothetical protein